MAAIGGAVLAFAAVLCIVQRVRRRRESQQGGSYQDFNNDSETGDSIQLLGFDEVRGDEDW
jgi:hypothetical protein